MSLPSFSVYFLFGLVRPGSENMNCTGDCSASVFAPQKREARMRAHYFSYEIVLQKHACAFSLLAFVVQKHCKPQYRPIAAGQRSITMRMR